MHVGVPSQRYSFHLEALYISMKYISMFLSIRHIQLCVCGGVGVCGDVGVGMCVCVCVCVCVILLNVMSIIYTYLDGIKTEFDLK